MNHDERVELALMSQRIEHLAQEIAHLRAEMQPAIEFQRRLFALSWAGRGTLYLVGALVATVGGCIAILKGMRWIP